jgi:lactoylglutathione lyase
MEQMPLGAFSVSLAVKNLQASREFYEKLGFAAFAGDATKGWLILKNGDTVIGPFQGMFEKNMLTFNTNGPAHFMVVDPDGNPILVDQHR